MSWHYSQSYRFWERRSGTFLNANLETNSFSDIACRQLELPRESWGCLWWRPPPNRSKVSPPSWHVRQRRMVTPASLLWRFLDLILQASLPALRVGRLTAVYVVHSGYCFLVYMHRKLTEVNISRTLQSATSNLSGSCWNQFGDSSVHRWILTSSPSLLGVNFRYASLTQVRRLS